jgi:UDP:flavonoid glycosyltransferase YjiC (YdhE family)
VRALFVAGQTRGLIFPLVPLAWALRAAGHDVLVTAPQNAMEAIVQTGLPGLACSPAVEMKDVMRVDRSGRPLARPRDEAEDLAIGGVGLGRLAARCVDGLLDVAAAWRPDLLVGVASAYAGALAAARLGVPWVRQSVDLGSPPVLDAAAAEELAPELARLGLDRMPEPALFLDTCPPSLRRPDAPAGRGVRYIPYNDTGELAPWVLARPDRPRLCITLGSRVIRGKRGGLEDLARLVHALATLPVELVVAATEEMARELGPLPEGVRAGWLPLDAVVPTCDVVVHHGGGNTMLTCLVSGVAQLVIPYMTVCRDTARRLRDAGCAQLIEPAQETTDRVLAACQELLAEPAYGKRAGALADEIAALPSPRDLVGELESLAARA